MIDLQLISLIGIVVGFLLMPIYSSYVMEWRIKRKIEQLKIEEFLEIFRRIIKGLENAGFIEAEENGEKDT